MSLYKISSPSLEKTAPHLVDKQWRRQRLQTFLAGTLGYALYYVCRLSMGVMKQPLIDAGLLNATQLGIIGACLYWAYAVGKLVNGFLADGSNIKRFMATGLAVSAVMNLLMGILGASSASAGISSSVLFVSFAVMWAINGWAQSMGSPAAIVSLSRWFPLRIRGTYYGFFSASHNIGEGISFIATGMVVAAFGWKWGFFGAAAAGIVGVILILLWMHDTPESKGLPSIEELSGEKAQNAVKASEVDTKAIQLAVIRNPGVWILALSSAFMYISRYAINEWGVIFLQEAKGYDLAEAAAIIGINPIFGIIGTVLSGWLSDAIFKGNRNYPAFAAGVLEVIALALFLFGGPGKLINIIAMVLFGIAIGVLVSFIGGLMAVDLVPRKATGAALGIVGVASYAAAGMQNVITGTLLDAHIVDGVHDFTYASWFWIGSAAISFLLPILNWKRKQQVI
jgi:OPA family sugar phosphate sensor protein UhpC-like MFS transporter